jgi:hypothetical protein
MHGRSRDRCACSRYKACQAVLLFVCMAWLWWAYQVSTAPGTEPEPKDDPILGVTTAMTTGLPPPRPIWKKPPGSPSEEIEAPPPPKPRPVVVHTELKPAAEGVLCCTDGS